MGVGVKMNSQIAERHGYNMSDRYVGERIRELREIQSYTREALAEKADISSKFLYEIETGKKGFSADVLCRLSRALAVSCDYIMLGKDMSGQGSEQITCVLETLGRHQVSRIQNILLLLSDMCQSF